MKTSSFYGCGILAVVFVSYTEICIAFTGLVPIGSLLVSSKGIRLSAQQQQQNVWIEEAKEGFVDEDENLMTGEVCLRAMKAFANDPDTTSNSTRFLGAAALVRRPSSAICDCWIADSLLEETNIQIQGTMLLIDDLFLYHLERSNANTLEEMISTFIIQSGRKESEYHCASYMSALNRGFKPLKDIIIDNNNDTTPQLSHLDLEEEDHDSLIFDISTGIERYAQIDFNPIATSISNLIQRTISGSKLEHHFE